MDVDGELRKLLFRVTEISQRRRALELWHRIKKNLSERQRLTILQAWNTYLINSNAHLFDETIETVIQELERNADGVKVEA